MHAADASLSEMGFCDSHCTTHGGQECLLDFGTMAIQVDRCVQLRHLVALWTRRSAPSALDLLNLTDCQALCLGTRAVFPEVSEEPHAAKGWRVLCAQRWKLSVRAHRGARVRSRPLDLSSNLQEEPIARTSTLNLVSDSWVCAASKGRSPIWSVAGRARELCGLCLAANAIVRYQWFPSERHPADGPSRRFEWSSQYQASFRVHQTQHCPRIFPDELDPSSADSQSKRKCSLNQRPL